MRAKALFTKLYSADDKDSFKASRSWRRRFGRRHGVKMRRRTNSKSKSVEERLPAVRLFHANTAALVSSASPLGLPLHSTWGRFLPQDRFNVDQARTPPFCSPVKHVFHYRALPELHELPVERNKTVEPTGTRAPPFQVPLPYVVGANETLDFVGNRKVTVKQQREGLEKRQATLNVCFHPAAGVDQPPLTIIFRGTGTRVSKVRPYSARLVLCVRAQAAQTTWGVGVSAARVCAAHMRSRGLCACSYAGGARCLRQARRGAVPAKGVDGPQDCARVGG